MKNSIFLLLLALSFSAQAKTIWSDYSVSYLRGNDYKVGDSSKSVVTFEYATGTSWGDSFMFFDRLESDNGDIETYGEWSPRIKLADYSAGVFKNIYFSATFEMGTFASKNEFGRGFTNYLLGLGTDLDIPGFNFFKVSLYHRNNDIGDNNYQTTVSWGVPLGTLYYDGFIDYSSTREAGAASMNFTSQLKYDLAPHLGLTSKLYLGIEYAYWLSKFGIDGVDEKNVSLLVKYHF